MPSSLSSFLPSILSRILLLAIIMMSLEGVASLEGVEFSHDDADLVHLHPDKSAEHLDEDSHCSHCFHQHSAGLLPRFDISDVDLERKSVSDRLSMISSNIITPPTPPPNR